MSRAIDEHRARIGGVEPICRMLTEHDCKIAPSIYYAHHKRLAEPSARTVRNARLKGKFEEICAGWVRATEADDSGESMTQAERAHLAVRNMRRIPSPLACRRRHVPSDEGSLLQLRQAMTESFFAGIRHDLFHVQHSAPWFRLWLSRASPGLP
ncbi:hypothetical protein [Streptomyces sp. RTGN2]|uniref:hypothetical protein n=1 Tax=Streptomyces sp. RTGN2 TaxID=3016525 RepID=UPI0025526825|nr:hypothetical protein [Streptomyces sp. RTGN2]